MKDKILNRGYGPTVREIGAEFGIRSPNGVMCHLKALEKKGLITRESHMSRAIQLSESPHERMTLQLAGVISAGAPIRPDPQNEKIDFSPLFDGDDHYVLKASGEVLSSEHVFDGDYMVVKKQAGFEDGDLVLAQTNGSGTMLRRAYREGERIRMESASPELPPVYPVNLDMLGIVVGVIRKY